MITTSDGDILYETNDINPYIDAIIYQHIKLSDFSNNTKGESYYNDFFTMDIETTTINTNTEEPIAFAYSIAVHIANYNIMFRTWTEYNNFISRLTDKLKLTLVCYVHNLPYEFQFMRSFMHITNVFATAKRKVVRCRSNGIEYRCSYKLTNMSLAKFLETIPNVSHYKKSGDDFDYRVIRTPSTVISPSEAQYILNDVAGLYEALDYYINSDNYNIATIPLTSTGFVRAELRHEMNKNPNNRQNMLDSRLDQYTYGLLREARRGGNTHCSPIWSNQELEELDSEDMSSAYPAIMVEKMVPMTKFLPIRSPNDFEKYIGKYACILDISFDDIGVKTMATVPYIAKAHCTQLKNILGDNGRVLSASRLSMVITDIDYEIIKETYEWSNVECRACLCAEYDYLPLELRKTLLKQYYNKTTLKGKDEYFYMKEKNKFNANFGCMLTDICQASVIYHENSPEPFTKAKDLNYAEMLNAYYRNKNSFLQYQHGVWVTAHCRRRLQNAINGLGRKMVYCDTDSVKFFKGSANRQLFERLNNEIREDIKKCGLDCTVHYNGKDYTLGLWEPDGDYEIFKSLGAKKYAYVQDGHFSITVAGLSKSKARDYMEQHGGIKIFKPGTVIPVGASGRTVSHYNDWVSPRTIEVNGEHILVGANVAITDTTYEFGLTEEYQDLILTIGEGVMF